MAISKIYEIQNKGKGVIEELTPENLLLLKDTNPPSDFNLTVGDVENVEQIIFDGATVTDNEDGSVTVTIEGGTSTDTLADVTGRGNVSEVPLIVETFGSQAEFGCDEDAGFPYIENKDTEGRIIFVQNNSGSFRRNYVSEEDADEIVSQFKSEDFTALRNQFYRINGTLEITNPSGTEGIYFFKVESGTTTVGSETFTAGDFVLMAYKDSAWRSTILNGTSSGATWGSITGTLSAQTDLQTELNRKANNLVLYNRTAWFAQRGSSGFGTIGITVANFVLSGNSTVSPTATNGYTIQVRTNFATSASAGTLAFYRIGTDATIMNTRFTFDGLFGFAGTTADTRFFYGLSTASTATPTNVEPTSIANILAFAKLSTSNNLHVIHNDASGTATSINLGANFPCDTNQTDSYYCRFEILTVGTVHYTVCRLNSDGTITHKAEGTITTDLPADNTLLYHRTWITNNATASISSFDFMGGSLGKN